MVSCAAVEFTLDLVAAPDDVDELGHVSNLVYLRWVLDAAKAHSRSLGWDFAAYRRIGAVWVVRRHEIEYSRPAYAGDAIRAVTWVATMQRASSLRRTRIVRAGDGLELARASTMWAFVDAAAGRLIRIPDDVRAAYPLPAAADEPQREQRDDD
jgi:acyl-CoA thioester hydrolase